MPVRLRNPMRRVSQAEFGDMAYEVMRHVFAIHNEIGRFFDERIYKQELAFRMAGVRLEEPVDVIFGTFEKRYFIDVVVGDGGLFEFKAVDKLAAVHRAQLLNYLLLCDLEHGKLINVRPENVDHEFVNSHWRHADRVNVRIDTARWNSEIPGAKRLLEVLSEFFTDVGAGLEITLFEEMITHFFGGPANVEAEVPIVIAGRPVGCKRMRLIAPGVALKLTCFSDRQNHFEEHARRLLHHTDLQAIAWVNIHLTQVTFATLQR